jgi:CubicO group peptidase (beta-lactamase class C family)
MPYIKRLSAIIVACSFLTGHAQTLYFPPTVGDEWETLSPSSLGWCDTHIDSMYDMLEENNTKALIILKDGKIVLEKYFGTFQQDSLWYWASAGKSLTACLVGIAQQEGFLSIDDATSMYLGEGWTDCTPEQEEKITIRDQLAMTSGLDDGGDPFCTLDTCLIYKADAGTRWAYHNGPYTLLDGVIENATGQNLNAYFQQKIRLNTGINGLFVQLDYNNVFFSQPRSMARFGLMILNNGNWNGQQILTDENYFNSMVNTSQNLNLSYGYLWWLNGKASYMVPGVQFQFPGSLMPNAPDDMIAALGKNGQYVDVVPSFGMVVIRMGNAPGKGEVPLTLNDLLWEHINGLDCGTTSTEETETLDATLKIFPNPSTDLFSIQLRDQDFDLYVYDTQGLLQMQRTNCFDQEDVRSGLSAGVYFVKVVVGERSYVRRVVVEK